MERLRRKPYIFAAAAVALVLGIAVIQFARPSRAENPRLEKYLPADAVGFVQVTDLRAQALKIIESEAWREFTKQNQSASSLFMMTANHAGALDASYALALLGTGADAEGRRRPEVVMLAEFNDWGARRTFENRVLRFVREAGEKEITKKQEKYEGANLYTFIREGQGGFAYATIDNTLYLSNSPATIKRALDVKAGKAPSLETNAAFAQARARAAEVDGMFGFLDGAALSRMIDDGTAAEGDKGAAAFRELFHGLGADGVRSASFTSAFDDGRVAEKFVVNAPEKGGVLASVAANPPTQQALLAYVPADALAAFDASIAGAPETFESLLALVGRITEQNGKKGPADALAEFTAKTGVDLREDILRSLGAEICLAQLPTPDGHGGVVILGVKDEAALSSALVKFAEHNKRAVTERAYKGVTIRAIAGEQGHGLEYAFVGGNLVASGAGASVERVIDTAQGGASLRASEQFRAASANLAGAPQFIYYNSNANYLNHLGSMLKGNGQEFKSEGQSAHLRPSLAYGLSRPEGFYVESRTPLGILPRLLAGVSARLGAEPQEKRAE